MDTFKNIEYDEIENYENKQKGNLYEEIDLDYLKETCNVIEINFEAQTDTRDLFERCAWEIEGEKIQNIESKLFFKEYKVFGFWLNQKENNSNIVF